MHPSLSPSIKPRHWYTWALRLYIAIPRTCAYLLSFNAPRSLLVFHFFSRNFFAKELRYHTNIWLISLNCTDKKKKNGMEVTPQPMSRSHYGLNESTISNFIVINLVRSKWADKLYNKQYEKDNRKKWYKHVVKIVTKQSLAQDI